MKTWSSIILAGGMSRRMGSSKALLEINVQTMVELLVEVLTPFSRKIIIVSNEKDYEYISSLFQQALHVQIVTDDPLYQGEGPLAGIYTGMKELQDSWYFVCACDMVKLHPNYLVGLQERLHTEIVTKRQQYDAFIPYSEGRVQPLAGLYSQQKETIKKLLDQNKHRITEWLTHMNYYRIEPSEWQGWTPISDVFFNMNKPEDYLQICRERGK
ncbi:molybdenum cofactor guanylyltransferase [Caldalkalibacillus mannanilyticus]|uniref:molybdenum cofactor guanylyltransferase n=1 Tax=Caldalkalibacillus mannanilyticus TaxID=1418 RepID=UPI00046AAFBC|nr:molybdenum cofactor guanylyltransferase [Caldalkalibacillus mannanilyticus]